MNHWNLMADIRAHEEIIDFIAAGTTPEAVVAFQPSPESLKRVKRLIELRQEGALSAEEETELEDYLHLEHIMIMAKARARRHLTK